MLETMNDEEMRRGNIGIVPIILPHAKEYHQALRELDWAEPFFLGLNSVVKLQIREAIASIGNALDLFKVGYSDAACFCLRQAIELATCFAYIHELPENERKEKLSAWKAHAQWFPTRGKMKKRLESLDGEYADMQSRMPRFFLHVEEVNERLNKHVHKQGYEYCYSYRRFLPTEKKRAIHENLVRQYEGFVKETIGVVAVCKLVIDPLPVLLSDEEVANRLPDMLTEPYSPGFMEKYLGEEFVREFKTTRRYEECWKDIMKKPRLNDAVYNIKQWYHFDRGNVDQVLDQIEQLNYHERLVVLLAMFSNKIARVYFHDGLLMYFTDVKSNNVDFSLSSEDFKKIRLGESRRNNPFKGSLLSVFSSYDNHAFFVEHDVPFEDNEWNELCAMVDKYNQSVVQIVQQLQLQKTNETQTGK